MTQSAPVLHCLCGLIMIETNDTNIFMKLCEVSVMQGTTYMKWLDRVVYKVQIYGKWHIRSPWHTQGFRGVQGVRTPLLLSTLIRKIGQFTR